MGQLPKLERLLLDADINIELEPLLKAVGFTTEFALRVTNIRSDTDILRWARRRRYILVCHDKFKDKQTRVELYPEIYKNGGRIIQVGGAQGHDPYAALGMILVQRNNWFQWFKEHNGIVTVHPNGWTPRDAHELYSIVQGKMPLETTPEKTLRHRERHKGQGKRRIRKISSTQPPLI